MSSFLPFRSLVYFAMILSVGFAAPFSFGMAEEEGVLFISLTLELLWLID